MTITALSLAITLTLSTTDRDIVATTRTATPAAREAFMAAAGQAPPAGERWRVDSRDTRPAALPVLYAAFGTLQLADAYSTRRAVSAGAVEANPLMRGASKSSSAMYAVKAASTAVSIYFAERAWKKNRRGAVIMMAAINGATAAIVARNARHAR